MEVLATVPLLIIDDLGMRRLGPTAAEELLEIVMRRYQRASTLVTSNRPVEDWGKLLGDIAAVTAMLDRLLHHRHILKCGPRSWRTKSQTDGAGKALTRNMGDLEKTRLRTSKCVLFWSFEEKDRFTLLGKLAIGYNFAADPATSVGRF